MARAFWREHAPHELHFAGRPLAEKPLRHASRRLAKRLRLRATNGFDPSERDVAGEVFLLLFVGEGPGGGVHRRLQPWPLARLILHPDPKDPRIPQVRKKAYLLGTQMQRAESP